MDSKKDFMPMELVDSERVKAIAIECKAKANTLNSQIVTESNFKDFDDLKKEGKDFIKDIDSLINDIESKLLEPFSEIKKALTEAKEPLAIAIKKHEAKCLEEKKKAYRKKAYEKFFVPAMELIDDGEFIDFKDIYEESWYNKSEKDLQSYINAKIRKYKVRDEIVSYIVTCDRYTWSQIEEATKGIYYSLKEVKE